VKVLVLGATGGTGRAIVQQLRGLGHVPVALVRSPARAKALDAQLVTGDARDEAALDTALVDCDAVISALGTPVSPFREVTLLSTVTRSLVAAMQRRRARRLVVITGIGAGDSCGHGGFLFDRILMPLLLGKVYADKMTSRLGETFARCSTSMGIAAARSREPTSRRSSWPSSAATAS
jgi:nucleoside-diphosphate-sugar epimerase